MGLTGCNEVDEASACYLGLNQAQVRIHRWSTHTLSGWSEYNNGQIRYNTDLLQL